MTDAEFIAIELADAYGLDPVRFMRASAFLTGVGKALQVMTADDVVRGVLDQGGLAGLVNPYAGVFSRITKLAEEQAWRVRLTDDEAEDTVASEFADEEIRAIALDALRGRLR